MTDEPYNASDRKAIRKAQKAARQAEVARGEVLKTIASTQQGRDWLWERLSKANVFQTVFTEEPTKMAFNEGLRVSGLDLLNQIMGWCPERFIEMIREHAPKQEETKEEIEDDDDE